MSVENRTQRTSLLRGPVEDIPGLTTYIATNFLPIAGGTMAGDLDMDTHDIIGAQTINAGSFLKGGLQLATEAYASNASNLASGIVPDERLSANVPLKNASNTYTGGTQTFGVAGTSNGQIVVGAAVSINAKITIGGSSNLVLSGANNGLGVTWQIITDTTGSNGPAAIRLGSTGSFGIGNSASNVGTVDTSWVRNATGPAFETRAAGGLKVCNTDGSATEKVVCSEIRTSTYRDNSGIRHLQFGGYFIQSDQQIFINAKPLTFGAITKTALLAKSPHVINEGVYRITDSTPAQRLAYPDGTNWRYASDDTIVT